MFNLIILGVGIGVGGGEEERALKKKNEIHVYCQLMSRLIILGVGGGGVVSK